MAVSREELRRRATERMRRYRERRATGVPVIRNSDALPELERLPMIITGWTRDENGVLCRRACRADVDAAPMVNGRSIGAVFFPYDRAMALQRALMSPQLYGCV